MLRCVEKLITSFLSTFFEGPDATLLFNTPGDGKLHCLHLGEDFPFVFSSRQSPDISVVGFGQEEYIGS